MTLLIIAVCVVLFFGLAFFLRNDSRAKWTSEAARYLFHLNVAANQLPESAANRFYSSAFNSYAASKGKLNPKIFAIDFFVWYLTEFPDPKLIDVINDRPLVAALELLRSWAEAEESPDVQDAAAAAYNRVCEWVNSQEDKQAA